MERSKRQTGLPGHSQEEEIAGDQCPHCDEQISKEEGWSEGSTGISTIPAGRGYTGIVTNGMLDPGSTRPRLYDIVPSIINGRQDSGPAEASIQQTVPAPQALQHEQDHLYPETPQKLGPHPEIQMNSLSDLDSEIISKKIQPTGQQGQPESDNAMETAALEQARQKE